MLTNEAVSERKRGKLTSFLKNGMAKKAVLCYNPSVSRWLADRHVPVLLKQAGIFYGISNRSFKIGC